MSKQSLLLVDGDTRSLRVLEVSLRKAGFMVTAALSVQDALDKLALHAPDLIISETTFPDGDGGFELRRRVRESAEWGEIPFIFLTAAQAIENKIRGLELGVDDYLTKPIYIKEIVTRINILLQKRQRVRFEERRDGRTRFAGRVQDMPVVDVIQTIEISRKSGVIQFVGERGRQAAIYFRDGRVIDAEAGSLQGEDAVYRLLTWNEGEFEVVFRTVRRREVITVSSQALLMEGMRRLDEWSRLFEQLPPLAHRFEVDTPELAARLGDVPDDNNRILRLFDGKRTLLEVIDASDVGDLECLQAVSRLYFEELLVDLDHGKVPRRDTGRHLPVAAEDAPTPIEEVASGPIATGEADPPRPSRSASAVSEIGAAALRRAAASAAADDELDDRAFDEDSYAPAGAGAVVDDAPAEAVTEDSVTSEESIAEDDLASGSGVWAASPVADEAADDVGPMRGSYRPSSLRLIDEAVAAAQAIEPSLFEDAPVPVRPSVRTRAPSEAGASVRAAAGEAVSRVMAELPAVTRAPTAPVLVRPSSERSGGGEGQAPREPNGVAVSRTPTGGTPALARTVSGDAAPARHGAGVAKALSDDAAAAGEQPVVSRTSTGPVPMAGRGGVAKALSDDAAAAGEQPVVSRTSTGPVPMAGRGEVASGVAGAVQADAEDDLAVPAAGAREAAAVKDAVAARTSTGEVAVVARTSTGNAAAKDAVAAAAAQDVAGEPAVARVTTAEVPVVARTSSDSSVKLTAAEREESGLRMIGSLGRDRAEASGELAAAGQAKPLRSETARELVTILPRRITREMPVMPQELAESLPKPTPTSSVLTAKPAVSQPIEPPSPSPSRVLPGSGVRAPGLSQRLMRVARADGRGPGIGALVMLVLAALLAGTAVLLRLRRHDAAPEVTPTPGERQGASDGVPPATPTPTPPATPTERGSAATVDNGSGAASGSGAKPAAGSGAKPVDKLDGTKAPRPSDAADKNAGAKAMFDKAHDAMDESNFAQALELANASLKLRKTARTYLLRAQAEQRLDQVDAALASVDAAAAISPEMSAVWETRGRILWAARRRDEARAAFEKFLELDPNNAKAAGIRRLMNEPR